MIKLNEREYMRLSYLVASICCSPQSLNEFLDTIIKNGVSGNLAIVVKDLRNLWPDMDTNALITAEAKNAIEHYVKLNKPKQWMNWGI